MALSLTWFIHWIICLMLRNQIIFDWSQRSAKVPSQSKIIFIRKNNSLVLLKVQNQQWFSRKKLELVTLWNTELDIFRKDNLFIIRSIVFGAVFPNLLKFIHLIMTNRWKKNKLVLEVPHPRRGAQCWNPRAYSAAFM